MAAGVMFGPQRPSTVRRLVSKLQDLGEGDFLRLERVFRLTGYERLDRLPQVFGRNILSRSL
jgi:hypothetical protein